jgi:inosine-uridine nucleoside N-ribohydrolase
MAKLPGVDLPAAVRLPNRERADAFLANRLADGRTGLEILALGPLTNIAEAFARRPEAANRVKSVVIMGGAIRVPGNLRIAWPDASEAAEFNIFVDPEAARQVFASGAPLVVVPLDATNFLPIDPAFVAHLRANAATPLAKFIVQIFDLRRDFIAAGTYFAWDPAAAAVLIDPSIATTEKANLSVETSGPNIGRLESKPGSSRTRFASRIDADAFRRVFLRSLAFR